MKKLLNSSVARTYSLALFAAILIGFLVVPSGAQAQSEKLKEALDQVSESVGALPEESAEASKELNSEATSTEPAPQTVQIQQAAQPIDQAEELASHQEALGSIVDFSILEVDEVLVKLQAALKSPSMKDSAASYKPLVNMLKERRQYLVDLKKTVASDTVDLEYIKATAADLKFWREQFYNPEVKLAIDVPLLSQAAEVLATALNRFTKISNDVSKIEARLNTQVLTPMLKEARASLDKAHWYRRGSQELLISEIKQREALLAQLKKSEADSATTTISILQDLIMPATTSTMVESTEPVSLLAPLEELITQVNEIDIAHKTVQLYTQQVSDNVKTTYQVFLSMSAKAKQLLNR